MYHENKQKRKKERGTRDSIVLEWSQIQVKNFNEHVKMKIQHFNSKHRSRPLGYLILIPTKNTLCN